MLEFELVKRYRGFALTVPPITVGDESVALYGPSGSGKSQTLQCLAGIVRPDAGRIALDGEVLFDSRTGREVPSHRRRIGYVPQSYGLFPHLSVAGNIAFGLGHRSRAERAKRVGDLIDRLGLADLAERRPDQISGGQQQRVALARALATGPRLLLLDEPLAALDPGIRGQIRADLNALRRDLGLPVVLVTHDRADVFGLADRVAVYQAGSVLQVGPRDAVFRHPASTEVARLTGTPNLLPAAVIRRDPAGLVVRCGDQDLIAGPAALAPGDRAVAVIRPELIQIVREDRPVTAPVDRNQLSGEVVQALPQGYTHRIQFRPDRSLGVDVLVIILPSLAYDRLGLDHRQHRTVAIAPEAIHLIPSGGSG